MPEPTGLEFAPEPAPPANPYERHFVEIARQRSGGWALRCRLCGQVDGEYAEFSDVCEMVLAHGEQHSDGTLDGWIWPDPDPSDNPGDERSATPAD